jgi:hypothetical protein
MTEQLDQVQACALDKEERKFKDRETASSTATAVYIPDNTASHTKG